VSDISTRYKGHRWFPPMQQQVLHFCNHGVLIDGDEFSRTTTKYYGDTTFEEAFRKTGTVTPLLHCCYTVVTLLLHCCHTVVTLLLHCRPACHHQRLREFHQYNSGRQLQDALEPYHHPACAGCLRREGVVRAAGRDGVGDAAVQERDR
jgi:hypothetical protein